MSNDTMTIKRFAQFALILSITFIFSACNMPVGKNSPYPLTQEQLRQTLAAQDNATGSNDTTTQVTLTPENTTSFPAETPSFSNVITPTGQNYENPGENYYYLARVGDTLEALSRRFDVEPQQISSQQAIPDISFIKPGQLLIIPNTLQETLPSGLLLPDSEVINSPSTTDFDIQGYVEKAGGFLSTYQQNVNGETLSGAEIIARVAAESSVNPRFLLAFLEFRSNWVSGEPNDARPIDYPIGFRVPDYKGLYYELILTATHLNAGYYGWRSGETTSAKFPDRDKRRLNPAPNAGTIAVQYLFAKFYHPQRWNEVLYGQENFVALYNQMFGDPWQMDAQSGPIFPDGLVQPTLELPFAPGERWSLTGGPHSSWNTGSPRGALDFAPVTGEPPCSVSKTWVTASAPGVIVRSDNNVVAIDLDGDGYEQTGWVVVFVHIAEKDQIAQGTIVQTDDHIGHPSCERGKSTGTHIHIARKYNGEWVAAEGPLPFVLSGWVAHAGPRNYQGELTKDGETVYANPSGKQTSIIGR